jgi:hypothetical protein
MHPYRHDSRGDAERAWVSSGLWRYCAALPDELDLASLGFDGVVPETTGRPAYHPATLLKIYLYGYLNRVPSSRRLERVARSA